jgi:hypothetical protein
MVKLVHDTMYMFNDGSKPVILSCANQVYFFGTTDLSIVVLDLEAKVQDPSAR